MKSGWTAALLVLCAGVFSAGAAGCAAAKSSINEFNRMDVGGGPGATLVQLTELQKKGAGKQGTANPAPVPTNPTAAPPSSPNPISTAPAPPPSRPPTVASASPIVSTPPPPVYLTPTPPAPGPEVPGEDYSGGPRYRMGPEDVLRVSVWENKELTLDVVVRPDGKISVPLIQDVQAEGLTAGELAEVIRQKLVIYIKDPHVSVIVLQVNATKFYVVGYVKNPGTYPLRGDVTVLQALSLAGGFTQFASPRKIRLVRNIGSRQEVRVINYYDMIDKGGEGNYLLRPGDTIVVP